MLTIPVATAVFIQVGMYSIFLAVYDIYISLTSLVKPHNGNPLLTKKYMYNQGRSLHMVIIYRVLCGSVKLQMLFLHSFLHPVLSNLLEAIRNDAIVFGFKA